MRDNSNVTRPSTVTAGLLLGSIAVVAFSISLPATRVAVGGLDPFFVAFGRAAGAGALAVLYLLVVRAPWPSLAQLRRLLLVVVGIVVGFPLLTSLALVSETSAHGAVVIACLPLATAAFAVLRAGERPHTEFWLASAVGMTTVLIFIGVSGGLDGGLNPADLYLLAAVLLGGLGYAEGGALAREMGGARTICWALVVSLPVTVPITAATARGLGDAGLPEWLGFGYVTLASMFLGFFAWYAALARGGVARVGQVQLAQPVLTLGWSAVLLGERVTLLAVVVSLGVLASVVWTQRARVSLRGSTQCVVRSTALDEGRIGSSPQAAPEPAVARAGRE
jgi:drug/metabolite transporter (DMT)-like permease